MFGKLFKYLIGYIVLQVKGGFSERFINLCAMRRIELWDITIINDKIIAKTATINFRKLRSVARKTGVKVKILQKVGLPFYLKAHKDRVGLLIGVGIFIFFMAIMNSFVWCIYAQNSDKISSNQILQAAFDSGLKYGVKVKGFDEEKAAREIYKAFDGELSWVKVNIKGSLAVVDFRDKVKKIEIDEKGEPSNIIANFDGVIISDETYQGSKNKSKGEAVVKGDILISGVVDGVDMKPLYYQAKGNFTALHTVSSETVIADNQQFHRYTDMTEDYCLCVFGVDIPLSFYSYPAENRHQYTYEKFVSFDGYRLPFSIKKTLTVKYNKQELTQREREVLAIISYSNETYAKFSNTNIISYNTAISKVNGNIKIAGEYQCIDFIGESKGIIIENTENS